MSDANLPVYIAHRYDSPERLAGSAVDQVWGRLASLLEIPMVRQPVEGAINLYTTGRSHFERPEREFSAYIGHGVADKGNWVHHWRRFDRLIVPFPWLTGAVPLRTIYGGSPWLERLISAAAADPPPLVDVLIATTINPTKNGDNAMTTSVEEAAEMKAFLESRGISVTVAPHPAQSDGKATPEHFYTAARVIVADPGSAAYVGTALRKPVILTPGTRPRQGTMEWEMVSIGHWDQAHRPKHLPLSVRDALVAPDKNALDLGFRFLFPSDPDPTGLTRWRLNVLPRLQREAREHLDQP